MKKILIVDSVSSYRSQVAWHLDQLGFEPFETPKGEDAIEAMQSHSFDAVLLDNDLVSKSGLEFVPQIRALDDKITIIVIVDPFFAESEHRAFLQDNRVAKTLRGPLSPANLSKQVRDAIHYVPPHGSIAVDRAKTESSDNNGEHQTTSDYLKSLRRSYQKKLPDELARLGESLIEASHHPVPENLDKAHRIAHTVHGTSGTLGFDEVSDLTGRIDDQLKQLIGGKPSTPALWEQIMQVYQRAKTVPERLSLVISVEPHTNNVATIIAADADQSILEQIAVAAHERCIDVRGATDVEELIEVAQGGNVEGAIIDLDFGGAFSIVEVVEALRAVENRAALPIALMSNKSSVGHRVAAAHAGATHFLPKPPDADDIADMVSHFAASNATGTHRVLIVDDDEAFREHIAAILREEGYATTPLGEPAQILEIAETVKPDIMLLDVIMPEISGFDAARMLRATTAWKEIPILFLTAEASPKVRLECFRSGGDDYIKKPVLKEELLARIEVRLERIRLYRERADRDALTSLPTRRAFIEMFKVRIAEGLRYHRPASLCLLDIDKFKFVNDTYGHLTGDRVLATLGQLLGSRFRTVDIRGRWGGEEFTIAFYGEEKKTAQMILYRVLEEFRQIPFEGEHGESFNCTFSCGISELPADGETTDELFRVADERLYKAKENGRNRIEVA